MGIATSGGDGRVGRRRRRGVYYGERGDGSASRGGSGEGSEHADYSLTQLTHILSYLLTRRTDRRTTDDGQRTTDSGRRTAAARGAGQVDDVENVERVG